MNRFNGNVIFTAGSQGPEKLRLINDGVSQSLSGVQEIELKLFERVNSNPTDITIKLTGNPQLLTIIDSANGIIQILPLTSTFTKITLYDFYVSVKDASGNLSAFPKGFRYVWEVIKG